MCEQERGSRADSFYFALHSKPDGGILRDPYKRQWDGNLCDQWSQMWIPNVRGTVCICWKPPKNFDWEKY